jgi:hypothetical protein
MVRGCAPGIDARSNNRRPPFSSADSSNRLRKKSEKQFPRGLKPARDDKNKGLERGAEAPHYPGKHYPGKHYRMVFSSLLRHGPLTVPLQFLFG